MSHMKNNINKWDLRFMLLAKLNSTFSKDTTKIGAVISKNKRQISSGYNGFPQSIADDERLLNRETKLKFVIHAEMNAILEAGKTNKSLEDSTLYVYGLTPCIECAKHIIASGITRVVYCIRMDKVHTKEWGIQYEFVKKMFAEACVIAIEINENNLFYYDFLSDNNLSDTEDNQKKYCQFFNLKKELLCYNSKN